MERNINNDSNWQGLDDVLRGAMSNLKIFAVGQIQIDLYFVGTFNDENETPRAVGALTFSVET